MLSTQSVGATLKVTQKLNGNLSPQVTVHNHFAIWWVSIGSEAVAASGPDLHHTILNKWSVVTLQKQERSLRVTTLRNRASNSPGLCN